MTVGHALGDSLTRLGGASVVWICGLSLLERSHADLVGGSSYVDFGVFCMGLGGLLCVVMGRKVWQ